MTEEQVIVRLGELFAQHFNISEATVSNKITTHARLFTRVRQGGGFGVRTFRRAIQWFSDNWPDQELPWPADIPRPQPTADRREVA